MASKGRVLGRARDLLEELSLVGLPALAAACLVFSLPGESRSQGEPRDSRSSAPALPLCDARHPGSGQTTPVDLGEIRRVYRELEDSLRRRLAQGEPSAAAPSLSRAYDAGLPACREEALREVELPPEAAAGLRGRRLYMFRASNPAGFHLPPHVEREPRAELLVVSIPHLGDLAELSRRLGRPLALAPAGLARALGIRCASTWIVISEKGDVAELHEDR